MGRGRNVPCTGRTGHSRDGSTSPEGRIADPDVPPVDEYLAAELSRRSDALVEEWFYWLRHRVGLRPVRTLPKDAVLNHIPRVMRRIADFLHSPVETVRAEVEDDLKVHAHLRYEQGYDIEELVTEYDILERNVSSAMVDALTAYPGTPDPVEVARLFVRLRQGLGSMTKVTLTTYRQTEIEQRRSMHRQLEEYVRTITHELKNPLQSVAAGVGMLEEGVEPGERERYVRMIRRGVDRVLDLIDDVRTLAVSGASQDTAEWTPLDEIVASVFDEVEDLARERGVRLQLDGPLPRITVDRTRVEIALINLVGNAIKYSDPDKARRWVRVSVRRAGRDDLHDLDRWEVRVADNGLGIPESEKGQVFERHFRAHPERGEGTGLGLSITRQMIEQLGGHVGFETEEGEGSTFYLVVPGVEVEEETDARPAAD